MIKDNIEYMDDCGENLSALGDYLDGYSDDNIQIIIKGYNKLSDDLKEYMDKMFVIFECVKKYNPNMIFVKEGY